jgi:hypothetical protein
LYGVRTQIRCGEVHAVPLSQRHFTRYIRTIKGQCER